eukprot:9189044-Pyramimonas_sp.AAC.1
MLSDLHAGPIAGAAALDAIVALAEASGCCSAVLNGDIAEGPVAARSADVAPLLRLARLPDGAYFVPGNHEYYNTEGRGGGRAEALRWTEWWASQG